MSDSIVNSYSRDYAAQVHAAYQRMGSKLRPTVRTHNTAKGAIAVFQRVGKGAASTKARHAHVPVMNVDHQAVECLLQDYYAGDWLDSLDELKTVHDERSVLVNAGAYALGRKTDEMIITELNKTTTVAGGNTDGLTKAKVLEAFEMLGTSDVPDDGERYAVVGWKQWSDLLAIDEFAKSDYVGSEDLPWRGTQAKSWLGALWMPHSGLPLDGNIRQCFWYHRTAVGHAIAADAKTEITYHGDRASWFINTMMSQGSVLIDAAGVINMPCLEV